MKIKIKTPKKRDIKTAPFKVGKLTELEDGEFARICAEVNRKFIPPEGLKPFEYDLYKHGLTQSMIGTFLSCERKFRLAASRMTSGNESGAIVFGNVYHLALEITQNKISTGAISTPEDVKSAMVHIMEEVYAHLEDDYQKALPDTREDYEFAYGCTEAMLPLYFFFWASDFFGGNKKTWLFSEREFKVEFAGVPLRGKIDGGYSDVLKRRWMLENKTKGVWNEGNLSKIIERDLQVNVYDLALSELDGVKYEGVLYNIIRRPQLRRKKDEDMKAFISRVKEDVETRPEWYFSRLEVTISEDQRAAFRVQLSRIVDRIKKWYALAKDNAGLDIENTSQCQQVYGACQFLNLCSSVLTDYAGLYVRKDMFSELEQANKESK